MMLALLSVLVLAPQDPAALLAATKPGASDRYVDFHADLERPGLAVVMGTLGKLKEGKRERMEDGKLGGDGAASAVSGTQYFKTTATAPIDVQKALLGAPAQKPQLQFELQIARLPDGKERRQLMTSRGTAIAEGALAMFVIDTAQKGKPAQLLQMVLFDPKAWDGGKTAPFFDAMTDVVAVNQHVRALEQAIAAVDAQKGEDAIKAAKEALQKLVDKRPEMKRTDDDMLLSTHVAPLEQRAKKRLAE